MNWVEFLNIPFTVCWLQLRIWLPTILLSEPPGSSCVGHVSKTLKLCSVRRQMSKCYDIRESTLSHPVQIITTNHTVGLDIQIPILLYRSKRLKLARRIRYFSVLPLCWLQMSRPTPINLLWMVWIPRNRRLSAPAVVTVYLRHVSC